MTEQTEAAPPQLTTTETETTEKGMEEGTAPATTTSEGAPSKTGLKVLFLSSDTGGGHRASAESLAKQFQLLFPGTTYDLADMVENEGVPIYSSLVSYYKHLSAHPAQWKFLYEVTNSRAFETIADTHLKLVCERLCRKTIRKMNPDVVVSVHPLMTNVPVLSCAKISQETGRHLPIFTVVTDLGSAHCLWFCNGVEKMFVGSDQIGKLVQDRGKVPDEKLVMAGLPIRHDFAVQAELMGDRMSSEGKAYQVSMRAELGLPFTDRKTLLVMGGGEGVGSLSNIVNTLYVELVASGIDAVILVVCGRNEKLQKALTTRDWDQVMVDYKNMKENRGYSVGFGNLPGCGVQTTPTAGCIEGSVTTSIRRILSTGTLKMDSPLSTADLTNANNNDTSNPVSEDGDEKKDMSPSEDVLKATDTADATNTKATSTVEVLPSGHTDGNFSFDGIIDNDKPKGKVAVVSLGFVNKMAEYMVAADVLVSKAGPGTISEAAALSLPVMLTSFLPGQEEGNVDFVTEGGFGAFCSDKDPTGIAEELVLWLNDDATMERLSKAAKAKGAPHAARDIAKAIGDSALKWKELNDAKSKASVSS